MGPSSAWIAMSGTGASAQLNLENGRLWPYLKDRRIYKCPDDSRVYIPSTAKNAPFDDTAVSYAMNLPMGAIAVGYHNNGLSKFAELSFDKLSRIPHPTITFVFIEAPGTAFGPPYYPLQLSCSIPSKSHTVGGIPDGCTISFADGHAIFWKYSGGSNFSAISTMSGVITGFDAEFMNGYSTPDVLQLAAWGGGPTPPGVTP
jgi:prepilin-type processing-associated H-X9-DG protein